jgi:hypothetical protein
VPRRDDQKLDVRNSKATLPVSGWRTPPLSSTPVKTECIPHAEKTDAATEFFTKHDQFKTSRATLASS